MEDIFECVWIAGFFEGEGTVRISKSRPDKHGLGQMQCEMSQVDPAPIDIFQARFPGRVYSPNVQGKQQPYRRWVIIGRNAVPFLLAIQPHLRRPVMIEKVRIALDYQAQKVSTHENRTSEYRARQADFFTKMATLNQRGLRVSA